MKLNAFDKKIWLASPKMHGEEQLFVQEAFDTNWVSTVGRNIDELEKNLSNYLNGQYAVALASGTAGLHMAVKLAGVKPGERVFCTDMTFSATVNPIVYEQGMPVFIDSEYETWNMDPEALEKAFAQYPDTKVVIVVNLYGTPAKLEKIREICDKHGAVLIEDAAESLGASCDSVRTGTYGDYNVISFNGNKIITTSGGGMFLTGNQAAARRVRKWSTQSRENAPWYQHEELGYNYRMSNVLAGVGRGQFLHLEEHIALKKAIYQRYEEGFKDLPVKMNPYEDYMQPNYWLSCMTVNPEAMCSQTRSAQEATNEKESGKTCPTEILEKLQQYNAEGRPIWKPMHMQPIYQNYPFVSVREHQAVDEDIFERGLCLPSDINMTEEQQEMVIAIVRNCFE